MNSWSRTVDRRTHFDRKAETFLARVQEEHMPEKAKMVVAINMATGEYVLGEDSGVAYQAFRERWPDGFHYMCCVDGSPSTRM